MEKYASSDTYEDIERILNSHKEDAYGLLF